MQGVAVTLLTEDRERLSVLQHRLEGTGMGRNVFSHVGFPTSPTDPVLRQMQDVRTEVVLVDIDAHNAARAISAIELIQANTSEIAIFAIGEMSHPPTIVAAMRAGGERISGTRSDLRSPDRGLHPLCRNPQARAALLRAGRESSP